MKRIKVRKIDLGGPEYGEAFAFALAPATISLSRDESPKSKSLAEQVLADALVRGRAHNLIGKEVTFDTNAMPPNERAIITSSVPSMMGTVIAANRNLATVKIAGGRVLNVSANYLKEKPPK